MLKILSLIAIVLGTTGIGALYGESLKKRLNQLYEMDRIMLSICNEITYLMTPLPEMFENISKDTTAEFSELFKRIAIRIKGRDVDDIFQAYKGIREDLMSEFYFNNDDVKIIDGFFRNLGDRDVNGEKNTIEYWRMKMKGVIKESEEKLKRDYKLVTSLSIAMGLVIVIILV